MKYKEPRNKNYCGTIVEIKTLIPLENMNNVIHAIIMGNKVIVSKDVKVGDVGIYFPVETQLSEIYLKINNLYRKKELNSDNTQKGFFEENGRIKCIKFQRIFNSEGLFMPISSISEFIEKGDKINIGDEFDELNGTPICNKYVIKYHNTPEISGSKNKGKEKLKKVSKLIEGQFAFHQDTSMLYKNLHRIKPDTLISITYKLHGTSSISSNLLCKKQLTLVEKILKKLNVNIVDTQYDNLFASRKVLKNSDLNPNAIHYYGEDIWGFANSELKEFLQDGLTFYFEIVGFLPNGGYIQKDFDYGCEYGKHDNYIYRITYTNHKGKVFEFSGKQVQEYCKSNGLTAVPELYYGYAKDILNVSYDERDFEEKFLARIKELYNEKDCYICKNIVPEEGCVIRIEGLDFEAYKSKSVRFYEKETKDLDNGEANIQDNQ